MTAEQLKSFFREATRLTRIFVTARDRGDRAAALIVRGRIQRHYRAHRMAGFWNDFVSHDFSL